MCIIGYLYAIDQATHLELHTLFDLLTQAFHKPTLIEPGYEMLQMHGFSMKHYETL